MGKRLSLFVDISWGCILHFYIYLFDRLRGENYPLPPPLELSRPNTYPSFDLCFGGWNFCFLCTIRENVFFFNISVVFFSIISLWLFECLGWRHVIYADGMKYAIWFIEGICLHFYPWNSTVCTKFAKHPNFNLIKLPW